MTQLKFDKNGFLTPQKINYDIKHEETDKEAIKQIELKKEVLKALKALEPNDRDLKSITIYCNPNYIYGPDYLIQEKIKTILKKLIQKNLVIQEKVPEKQLIYTLIKTNEAKRC